MSKYSKTDFAADVLLDLFAEYFEMANDYREVGNELEYRYWANRTLDLSREYHRIKEDIKRLDSKEN